MEKILNIGIDLATKTTGIAFFFEGQFRTFLIKNQKFNPNIFNDSLINFSVINNEIQDLIKTKNITKINIGVEVSNFAKSHNNTETSNSNFQNKFNPMVSNWFHFYAGLIYGLVQWNFKDSDIVFKWKFFNANEWFPKFLEDYNKKNLTNYSVNFLDSFSRKKIIVDYYLEDKKNEDIENIYFSKKYFNEFGNQIIFKSKEWYLEVANELEALSIARYFEFCESTIHRGEVNTFKKNFTKKKKLTLQQKINKIDSKINKVVFEINNYIAIANQKKLTKSQELKKQKLQDILQNLKGERFEISKK